MKINYSSEVSVNSYTRNKSINVQPISFKSYKQMLSAKKIIGFADSISRDSLELHLKNLTDAKMEGRSVGSHGIELAKDYIQTQFKDIGLAPVKKLGLNSYLQPYKTSPYMTALEEGSKTAGFVWDKPNAKDVDAANIVGMIKGSKYPKNYVILTAHYDHLGKTKDGVLFPGADDNASSVSTLLEIAKAMKKDAPKRSVIFAALSGEENYRTGVIPLMDSLENHNMKKNVEIIDVEMLGAQKGKTLDVFKYMRKSTNSLIENIKTACETIGTKCRIIASREHVLNNGEKFANFKFPSVCVAWDYKGKNTHPYYHTSLDTFESVNKDVFEKAAKSVAAVSYVESNTRPEVIKRTMPVIISKITNFFKPKSKKVA